MCFLPERFLSADLLARHFGNCSPFDVDWGLIFPFTTSLHIDALLSRHISLLSRLLKDRWVGGGWEKQQNVPQTESPQGAMETSAESRALLFQQTASLYLKITFTGDPLCVCLCCQWVQASYLQGRLRSNVFQGSHYPLCDFHDDFSFKTTIFMRFCHRNGICHAKLSVYVDI